MRCWVTKEAFLLVIVTVTVASSHAILKEGDKDEEANGDDKAMNDDEGGYDERVVIVTEFSLVVVEECDGAISEAEEKSLDTLVVYETRDVELISVEENKDSIADVEEDSLATLAVYDEEIRELELTSVNKREDSIAKLVLEEEEDTLDLALLENVDDTISVSYTHLDVYKRQLYISRSSVNCAASDFKS